MRKSLIKELNEITPVVENEPLAQYTTYKVGGNAAYFISPNSDNETSEALRLLCLNKADYFLIGNGSNLLISDKGYPGVVVRLGKKYRTIKIKGSIAYVGAMVPLWELVNKLAARGLSGLEELAGIPGSIGGALKMNASAYGKAISEKLIKIRGIDRHNCEMHWFDQGAVEFEYRKTPNRLIYLWAEFLMMSENIEECMNKVAELNAKRAETQPLDKRSAGCVFKNPENDHAGKLIDESGLKGLTNGGAEISDRHANFIIAHHGATADDIWQLSQMIIETVKTKTGITLEREIIIKGEFDGKIYF